MTSDDGIESAPRPRIITKSDPSCIAVEWDDGTRTVASAKALRDACPCAHCVDEWTGRQRHDASTVPDDLETKLVTMVGHYALAIAFADGHATGIYPWKLLRSIGAER